MIIWAVFYAFLAGAHLTFAFMHADEGERLEFIVSLAFAFGCAAMSAGAVALA